MIRVVPISKQLPALLFVLLQSTVFVWFVGDYRTAFAASLIAAGGCLLPARRRLGRSNHAIVLGILTIGFILLRATTLWFDRAVGDLFLLFSQYLLLIQSLEFARSREADLTSYVPGLGIASLTFLVLYCDASIDSESIELVAVVLVALLYCMLRSDLLPRRTGQHLNRRKWLTLSGGLAAVLLSGALLTVELRVSLPVWQERLNLARFENSGAAVFASSSARFIEKASLGSLAEIQRIDPNAPVFTVMSAQAPGYMRVAAFDRFLDDQWGRTGGETADDRVYVRPVRQVPNWFQRPTEVAPQARLFEINPQVSAPLEPLVIEILASGPRKVPLPAPTRYVFGVGGRMVIDANGAVLSGIREEVYAAFVGMPAASEIAETRPYLQMPNTDREMLVELATQVCGASNSFEEIVDSVESFLSTEFSYTLDPRAIPAPSPGSSSLKTFLETRHAAHCEYFAASAAMLLRARNIPTRLVIGYLCVERDDEDEFYISRNEHAHAWVEAYDESTRRWYEVEATPGIAALVGERIAIDESNQAADAALAQAGNGIRLRDVLYEFWVQVRWVLLWPFRSPAGWGVLLVAVGTLYLMRGRYHLLLPRRWYSRPSHHHYFDTAERAAAKAGYVRMPNETCHQFADRLAREGTDETLSLLAAWYRTYAVARYRSVPAAITHPPTRTAVQ